MNTQDILQQLGLSATEITVYVAMVEGKTQVKDIIKTTGMKRPSVYYAINKLESRGLIGRMQHGEYNQWQLSDPHSLQKLLHDKQKHLQTLEQDLEHIVEAITTDKTSQLQSQVTFYEGQKAVENIVFNSLYCKNKEILSIAPDKNFFHQTGQDFAMKYVMERKQRNIKTRHLWESLGPVTKEVLKEFYTNTAEVRIMPSTMQQSFASSVFMYDDTVMYVSSQLSGYAVVFTSKEHAELQRALFETVWGISKKVML